MLAAALEVYDKLKSIEEIAEEVVVIELFISEDGK